MKPDPVHSAVVHDDRAGTGETSVPLSGSAPLPATAAGEPAMPCCSLPAPGDGLPVGAPEQNPPNARQRMPTSVFVAFREGFFVHASTCCGSIHAMWHEVIL